MRLPGSNAAPGRSGDLVSSSTPALTGVPAPVAEGEVRHFPFTKSELMAGWPALLRLGRWYLLPTIWSNCLAGWLLNGGGATGNFVLLCLGATCLYLGGLFLNDAGDADYDTLNHRHRPIPAGIIQSPTAYLLSLGWFALGGLLLCSLGKTTGILTLLLLGAIVFYNVAHQAFTLSPEFLGLCRFLLYLLSGSATGNGISGLTIWSGLALLAYCIGLNCLMRQTNDPFRLSYWPGCLLVCPLALAWFANAGGYRVSAGLCGAVLLGWMLWCWRFAYWLPHRNIPFTVTGLTAGMVLVDGLAVAGGELFGGVFILWFVAALLFRRLSPTS